MKQFMQVLRFEFLNYAKSKVFIILTVLIVLVVGVVLSFPRITQLIGSQEEEQPPADRPVLAVQAVDNAQQAVDYLAAALPDYQVQPVQTGEDVNQGVRNGTYEAAVILDAPLSYRYVTVSVSLTDTLPSRVDTAMAELYRLQALEQAGVTAQQAQEILTAQPQQQVVQLGTDQMQNFFYTYILMLLLYMAIILYGQLVASGVAAEKSSRAMELLITSVRPTNLIFGKIMGAGLAGLTQLVVILAAAFGFYNLNRTYWEGNAVIASIFDMPLGIMLYTVLFFVLGFFLYAFLFGALASLADRSEDVNTLVLPANFLFLIAFFVVFYSMMSGEVDAPLMVACSYIPFTSPMAMFTRIAIGNPQAWEIVLSVAILILSVFAVGKLSAAIYRVGVLLYGKPPRMRELLGMLRARR
ncbi:MAG TPA: ABC transporter permease [Candidatus Gallacutalibacter stercoravium]|nr:ABC transporter permease [Candidatus Gallacutalibacter stercoravium]